MGGRYGGGDDGSDEYQDRRPKDDDLDDKQQTVAEAVHAVAERQRAAESESSSGHADDSGRNDGRDSENGDRGSGHHPFTSLQPGSSTSGSTTLQDIDQQIAEYVADQLTESVKRAVEKTDPDDTDENT